uniref:Uncharacterized protein n=1 Tax=Ciona savignyi TaxID=51511 RepID=H2YU85_CIOSA
MSSNAGVGQTSVKTAKSTRDRRAKSHYYDSKVDNEHENSAGHSNPHIARAYSRLHQFHIEEQPSHDSIENSWREPNTATNRNSIQSILKKKKKTRRNKVTSVEADHLSIHNSGIVKQHIAMWDSRVSNSRQATSPSKSTNPSRGLRKLVHTPSSMLAAEQSYSNQQFPYIATTNDRTTRTGTSYQFQQNSRHERKNIEYSLEEQLHSDLHISGGGTHVYDSTTPRTQPHLGPIKSAKRRKVPEYSISKDTPI